MSDAVIKTKSFLNSSVSAPPNVLYVLESKYKYALIIVS